MVVERTVAGQLIHDAACGIYDIASIIDIDTKILTIYSPVAERRASPSGKYFRRIFAPGGRLYRMVACSEAMGGNGRG